MQTFLPYPSFARSAAVLDDRRLGKQRVEVLQILRALHMEDYGWAHHPAVLMWRGCTRALVAYGLAVVDEWCTSDRADTTRPMITEFARPFEAVPAEELPSDALPPWLGWPALHRSHQAALVRKDPLFYEPHFPGVTSDEPYVWPDPPAGPPTEQPFSAWAVRAASDDVLDAFLTRAIVGLPITFTRSDATRKQRRQLASLRAHLDVGDPVALIAGDMLHCGVVAGPPRARTVRRVRHLVRPVVWRAAMPRAELQRPYQLQDPRLLFTLRGETAVTHLLHAGGRQIGSDGV